MAYRLFFFGNLLYNRVSSAHVICSSGGIQESALSPIPGVLKVVMMTEVSYFPSVTSKTHLFHITSAAWCVGEPSFAHPVQHQKSGCQGELQYQALPKQLEPLGKQSASLLQLEYRGLRILCTLDSKALEVDPILPWCFLPEVPRRALFLGVEHIFCILSCLDRPKGWSRVNFLREWSPV